MISQGTPMDKMLEEEVHERLPDEGNERPPDPDARTGDGGAGASPSEPKGGEKAPEEEPDLRERVEKKLYKFIRYFFPAAVPLLIYVGIVLASLLVGSLVLNNGMPIRKFMKEMTNVYAAIGVVITFHVLWKRSKKTGSTFFEDATLYRKDLSLKKTLSIVGFGIGTAFALSALISLLPKVGLITTYETHVENIYQRWSVFLSIIFNTFFTPLVEEVVFRGYMLNGLMQHFEERHALLMTTIVFSLMHGTAIWILYAFAMGWIIGRVSIWEDNIFYAIMLHIGFNLPSALMWYLYLKVDGVKEALDQNRSYVFLIGLCGALMAWGCASLYLKTRKPGAGMLFGFNRKV